MGTEGSSGEEKRYSVRTNRVGEPDQWEEKNGEETAWYIQEKLTNMIWEITMARSAWYKLIEANDKEALAYLGRNNPTTRKDIALTIDSMKRIQRRNIEQIVNFQIFDQQVAHNKNLDESLSVLINQDFSSYEAKKTLAIKINDLLREEKVDLAHPITGEACRLVVVANRDKLGRYGLENRVTKKRSGVYKSFRDLLPVKLVEAAERKEGFREARKKKEAQASQERPPEKRPRKKKPKE